MHCLAPRAVQLDGDVDQAVLMGQWALAYQDLVVQVKEGGGWGWGMGQIELRS